jgi:glucuronosyltransferase
MDDAKHGVIYFSMGSTWKSKDIPKRVKNGLLKMFGELKQTVIWKYEDDLPGTPPNLHVKWAPQQSILGSSPTHPNTHTYITPVSQWRFPLAEVTSYHLLQSLLKPYTSTHRLRN